MTFDPIAAAMRVENFLTDPTIRQVLDALQLQYFRRWLESKDPTERERLHAEASALATFEGALKAVVDGGLLAAEQARLERRSE